MANILIAEDSATAAVLLTKALAPLGHKITIAKDGAEAEEKIQAGHPDLVILDIIMPGMNGFQLCRSIRSDPDLAGLPIIIVTAMDRDSDRYWGLKQGANEYFVKPVDPETLTETVNRYLPEGTGVE